MRKSISLVFVMTVLLAVMSSLSAATAAEPATASSAVVNPAGAAVDSGADQGSASSDDAQFSGDLANLENTFFYHTFPNDTVDQRLDRLEKLVYGATKSGSTQKRITRLLLDVPRLSDPLSRAEGDSGSIDSTSDASASSDSNSNSPAFSNPTQPRSLISEVAAMENEVYGKTHDSDTLIDRVNRLEKTVFPQKSQNTFSPITTRINLLIQALQPKFSAPATLYTTSKDDAYPPQAPNYARGNSGEYTQNSQTWSNTASSASGVDDKSQDKKKGHPFLHKLGKFIGDVGTVAGVAAASMAAGSMMGYGYGGYGWGYPGFGYPYGMGGYGFGRPFMGCW